MKNTLTALILLSSFSAHAARVCTVAYATDLKIVDHAPVETKLKSVKLNAANPIPGTDREVWVTPVGTGLAVSLASKGNSLGSARVTKVTSPVEITLDVPNGEFDEYVRVSCR